MRRLLAIALLGIACAQGVAAQSAAPAWKAVELWRVDGTEGGEPFGDLRDYVVLRDGSLWALDFKDQTIRRYSAEGRPLANVARKGSGPGELGNANGMAVSPDGSVWVNDPRNARLSVFTPDGKFQRQVTLPISGYRYRWDSWFDVTSRELFDEQLGTGSISWRRLDAEGKVQGTVPYASCPSGSPGAGGFRAESKGQNMMSAYPFTIGGGIAADRRGNVWCAAPRASRVALLRLGTSDTVAVTATDIPNVPVGREERQGAIASIEKRLATFATHDFDRSKVPHSKPGIGALYVDEDGRLWVQHAVRFGVASTTYDIFDGRGRHLARLALPVRSVGHLPLRARGDAVWLTVLDEDDVPSIVRYRVTR
jgi:streptogramin lyase